MPPGVYALEDLKKFGRINSYCPYFLTPRMIGWANAVIYIHHYLLDPKVAEQDFSSSKVRSSFSMKHTVLIGYAKKPQVFITRSELESKAPAVSKSCLGKWMSIRCTGKSVRSRRFRPKPRPVWNYVAVHRKQDPESSP
ncbi:hypothetical protein BJ742DRAFT_550841 [Cladochytrium replicatum]|nr:hypothetical protein BJ742DRAFT_550841 [Cladochytrium replicatum]